MTSIFVQLVFRARSTRNFKTSLCHRT